MARMEVTRHMVNALCSQHGLHCFTTSRQPHLKPPLLGNPSSTLQLWVTLMLLWFLLSQLCLHTVSNKGFGSVVLSNRFARKCTCSSGAELCNKGKNSLWLSMQLSLGGITQSRLRGSRELWEWWHGEGWEGLHREGLILPSKRWSIFRKAWKRRVFPYCILFMQVAERGLDTAKQEVKHL